MNEERVAVLESRVERNEKDVTRLFAFFREQSEKAEGDQMKILSELGSMNNKMDRQKSFWAGMVFAFTGIGAVVGSAVAYLKS